MHLKIEANGEEQIFVFKNKTAITIGRSQGCDISLSYEGVSRVHLQVHERGGEYFVEDMGATNGTFINNEPIKPKELAPFNSFFPIKLGHSVYLYLLDEVAAEQMQEQILADQELKEREMREKQKRQRQEKLKQERVYVPKSQGKVKAEDLSGTRKIKRKKIAVGSRQKPQKTDKLFLKALGVLTLIIIGGFAAKNVILKKLKEGDTTIVTTAKKLPAKAPVNLNKFGESKAQGIINLGKCLGTNEEILCKKLTGKRSKSVNEGFVQLLSNMYFTVDLSSLASDMQAHKYSAKELKEVEDQLKLQMGRAFSSYEFKNNNFVMKDVDPKSPVSRKAALLTDLSTHQLAEAVLAVKEVEKLYVVLYDNTASKKYLGHVIFDRDSLKKLAEQKTLENKFLFFWRSGLNLQEDNFKEFSGIELKSL